jgi:hypothetical protein
MVDFDKNDPDFAKFLINEQDKFSKNELETAEPVTPVVIPSSNAEANSQNEPVSVKQSIAPS